MTKKVPAYNPRQYTVNPPVKPIGKATVSLPSTNQRSSHIPEYKPRYATPQSNKGAHELVREVQRRVHGGRKS